MMQKRYMGIDFGTKKLGIAISDGEGKVAFPKEVIPNDHLLYKHLEDFCERENIAEIVIGESKNFHGEANPVQNEILKFVHLLERHTGLSVSFEPEFLTTQQAAAVQGRNKMTDASAAALILQSFLDRLHYKEDRSKETDEKEENNI